MIKAKSTVAVAAAVGLLVAGTALAQTDPHHPPGSAPVPSAPPAASTPAAPAAPGMAMPGGAGSGMSMMGMMNMMGQGGGSMPDMGMHGMEMRGMAMTDRVEGRIAFLRAELKIADAQTKVWNDFAQSLRDNAKRLADVRDAVVKSGGTSTIPTLAQRLDSQERWLVARVEVVRAIKAAFAPLYGTLSADQKKSADDLLGMHMGLMPSGMMSMGMMSGGGMMMPMGGNVR